MARSVQLQRDERLRTEIDKAGIEARAELREHLLRLADPELPPADAVLEADILGLCMYLQRLRCEVGEQDHRLDAVASFITDRAERCSFVRQGQELVCTIERASRTPVTLGGVTVGDQRVVRGAPLALVDAGGRAEP
jgi:hypothetical protein